VRAEWSEVTRWRRRSPTSLLRQTMAMGWLLRLRQPVWLIALPALDFIMYHVCGRACTIIGETTYDYMLTVDALVPSCETGPVVQSSNTATSAKAYAHHPHG
jgi:hypothetical protein